MTESDVWRRCVHFLIDAGYQIHCGSPPGSTSYAFKNCILIRGEILDSPDIIFSMDSVIYLCECKATLKKLYEKNRHGENDIDKLRRLVLDAQRGYYNDQLLHNYGVTVNSDTMFRPCICYPGDVSTSSLDCAHMVVTENSVNLILSRAT